MKIARVHIENYRSIKQLDFSPNNYCALIGENNAGKSNILKAINLVLGETWPTDRTFTEEDLIIAILPKTLSFRYILMKL